MYPFDRKLTWRLPSGRVSAGTPSGKPVAVPGMFQISQCVMSILEPLLSTGSGSCISSTKLCVPIGTCDHFSSGDGDIGPPACVYLSGITPPSSNAVVVISSGGGRGGGAPPPGAGCPCADTCPDQAKMAPVASSPIVELSRCFFIVLTPPIAYEDIV